MVFVQDVEYRKYPLSISFFTLVIIVALFNLISALIMMILDKRKSKDPFNLEEIKDLRKIFLLQVLYLALLADSWVLD
jgi:lipoprotein-releasing system permease protein